MRKKKQISKLAKRLLVAVVLATIIAVNVLTNIAPIYATNRAADNSTVYSYQESLGNDASTEYSGRVWTDKSVFEDDYTFTDSSHTVTLDPEKENFLVSFSTLATSQAVKGQTKAALDVVFVIDMSNSMNNNTSIMANGKSRLENMVDALNTAVETILATSENARIGVIAFNGTSTEILPLDHYTKYTETVSRPRPGQSQTVLHDFFELNGTTINTYAINSLSQNVVKQTPSNSGTNIQKGIAHGMSLLLNEESTTVNVNGTTIQRVPTLILLSDGEPTSSSDKDWWNMASDTTYYNYETDARADNAMKVLMTAGYMKKQINSNYASDGIANDVTVYTVGVGLEKKEGNALELARISLTPEQYLTGSNVSTNNNTIRGAIYNGLNSYFSGGTPTVAGYKFNRAPLDLVSSMEDVLYSDYYRDVADTDSIAEAFENIVENIVITNAEVPTEMATADALSDGYVTYTDPIGQYMEVKDVKGIIYNNQYFPVSYNSSTKAVTIDDSYVVTTSVHGQQQLSHLNVEITEDASGNQTMTIRVPAALIPLRINSIELNTDGSVKSNTSNGKMPIRVIYSVGLQEGVMTKNGVVDTNYVSADYIKANTNENGSVNFYSNVYTGNTFDLSGSTVTVGNATAQFEPSHSNNFYYILSDTPIYKKDGANYIPVTSSESLLDDGLYYFSETYYYGSDIIEEYVERTGAQVKKTDIVAIDGYLYRAAGSPRINRILEFEGTKATNITNTASEFYVPTFEYAYDNPNPYAGKFVIYLGNNGVLNVPASGTLEISKDVELPANATPSQDTFNFTVDFNGNSTLEGSYPYTVIDSENNTISSGYISDGGILHLKDGYVAHISGLPHNTTYSVTEEVVKGFSTTIVGNTGTIVAGDVQKAQFTNTYEYIEIETDSVTGTKVLGRDFEATDKFAFEITALTENAPTFNPTDVTNPSHVVIIQPGAGGTTATFDFGTVTFTQPGEYVYQVLERNPTQDANRLSGVAYSKALYDIVYTVKDNGDGTLSVTKVIKHLQNDLGEALSNQTTSSITFTNNYDADHAHLNLVAIKNYTDITNAKPLTDGMFTFTLTPLNGAPMPAGTSGSITVGNIGTTVTFPSIEYSEALFGTNDKIEFQYEIKEEVLDINGNTIYGMDYDENIIIATVKLAHETSGAKVVIEDVVYTIKNTTTSTGEKAVFNNTYEPKPATIPLNGIKTISGRDWLDSDQFAFTWGVTGNDAFTSYALTHGIIDVTNVAFDAVATKSNPDFSFGSITIPMPGTYKFYIREANTAISGVTKDMNDKYITIVVTDPGNGQLEATVTYDNGSVSTDTTKAVFENVYTAQPTDVVASLKGTKSLTGKSLVAGEFYFEVTDLQTGKTTLVTHTADATDNITLLEGLTFDSVGTYVYEIKEQIPTHLVPGTDYDTSIYRYTITVTDNTQGKLEASTKIEVYENGAWSEVGDVVFSNEYEPNPTTLALPTFTKVFEGYRHDAVQAGEFKFELSLVSANPADGITLPANTTITNDSDGFISFGDLTFTKAGVYQVQVKEIAGTDSSITYDDTVLTATITVSDDRNGTLTAVYTHYFSATHFVNKYESEGSFNLTINKELTGRDWFDSDVFEFEVVVLDPATQEAIDNDYINFTDNVSNIAPVLSIKGTDAVKSVVSPNVKVTKEGTYKFIVREVTGTIEGISYDSNPREVTVTAIDQNNGTINVTYNVVDAENNGLTFKNVYDPDSTHLSGHDNLVISKTFEGRGDSWLDTDTFTFTLAAADQTTIKAVEDGIVELPASTTLVVSNSNKAHPHFGDIIFHDTGTFKFTVTEETSTILGVTNDVNAQRTIVVRVTDDGQGELVASLDTSASDNLEFKNTYSYDPIIVAGFEVTKDLVGRDWNSTDEFEFVLSVTDEATLLAVENGDVEFPAELSIKVTSTNKTVRFGDIKFNEVGIYKFSISEVRGTMNGVSYDSSTREITAVVTDKDASGNPVGVLTAELTFEPDLPLIFTNVYTPEPVKANIEVVKELFGLDMKAGKFRFHIAGINGAPMPSSVTVTNGNNPSKDASIADFGTITYTQPGTYRYEISEIEGTLEGVTYDKMSVYAVVEVTYDATTGLLSSNVSYINGDNTFTNMYKGTPVALIGETNLKVNKTFTGRPNDKWLSSDKFEFTLAPNNQATADAIAAGDIVMPNTTLTINVDNKDNAYFGNIIFKEVGDDYEFVVKETNLGANGIVYDTAEKVIKVKVTDSGIGKLVAVKTGESDALEFTNKYTAQGTLNLTITKDFTGRPGNEWLTTDSFEFEIVVLHQATQSAIDRGLVVLPTSPIVIGSSKQTSTGNFVFNAEGTYKFIIREKDNGIAGVTYDSNPRELTVVVTDTDSGSLNVEYSLSNSLTFVNTYMPSQVELEGHTNLVVNKVFTGRENNTWLDTDKFVFTIAPYSQNAIDAVAANEIIMPNSTLEVTSANKAHAHFGNITFKTEGTYEFIITELTSSIAGVIDDTDKDRIIKVQVVDTHNGYLTVEKLSTSEEIKFTNTYYDATVEIIKSQTVNGQTGTPLTVRENDEVVYSLTVTNTGLGVASDVIVTDTIPAGLTLVGNPNNAIVDGNKLTWSIGTLSTGETATVNFSVTVPDVTTDTTWKNIGVVTYTNPDGSDGDPETSNEVVIEQGTPNVTITKTQSLNGQTTTTDVLDVKAGDELVYTIKAVNTGKEEAENVVITDTIPSELVYVSHSAGDLNNGTITWNVGTLATNGSAELTVTVKVPETDGKFKVWTNTAYVDYDNDPVDPEPDPSNPVSIINSVAGTIKGTKQLSGDRTAFADGEFSFVLEAVTPGAPLPAQTTVGNIGSLIAFEAIELNTEGTYVYKVSEVNGGQTINGVYYDASVYYAKIDVVKEVSATPEETVTTYVIKETEYYSDESLSQKLDNGFVFVNTYYDANVVISKAQSINGGERTTEKQVVREGDEVTYYLTVRNNAQGVASDVVITDQIPEGLTLASVNNDGIETNRTITWTIPTLGAGESVEVSFTVIVPEVKESEVDANGYKTWENIASVTYKDPDGTDGAPDDSEKVEIEQGVPKVSIEKAQQVNDNGPITNAITEVVADDVITYYITIENTGTEIAEDIVVKDVIPVGLTLIDASISNHGHVENGEITWLIDALEIGEKDTLTFKVKVPTVTVDTEYRNIATIAYENNPEDPTDPEESNEVVVEEGVPSLVAQKQQSVNNGAATTETVKVEEGDKVTYIITVTNTGTGSAKDIVITDKVPTGLELVANSITENGQEDNGTITWKYDRLGVGESVVVKFAVTVPDVEVDTEWTNIASAIFGNNPEGPTDPEESNEVVIEEGVPNITVEKLQSVNNGIATKEKVTVKANDSIIYSIKIKNIGTETAKEIVVTDQVPDGLGYVENTANHNGIYSNGTITWVVDELEVGAEMTLQFTVKVPSVTEDTIWVNIAKVEFENNPDKDEEIPSNPVESEEKFEQIITETGDDNNIALYAGVFGIASIGLISVIVLKKKKEEQE